MRFPYFSYKIFRDNEIFLAAKSCNFVIRALIKDNKLNISYYNTPKTLYNEHFDYSEDSFFYIDNNAIKAYNYSTGATVDLYNSTNLVPTFNYLNNEIIFYEYLNKTTVCTFKIPVTGGEKKQFALHDAKIKNLMELNL